MFRATPFVVFTCALLIMTAEGWLWSRSRSRHQRTEYHDHHHYRKRAGTAADQEVEKLKAECQDLDMDPVIGITENDVVTAFRKTDVDGNGALLSAELKNFTSVLEIYETCETVYNIV